MRCMHAAILFVVAGTGFAQEKIPVRYGIEADPDRYPQKTAKDALRSVLKAIESRRVEYLLAHLAEPAFVDQRVKDLGGRFEVMVQETAKKLDADPESLRELRRILSDGEWQEQGDIASAKVADVRGKMVFLKRIGNRWFLENRTRPAKDS
jgi:hypothetical protein